MKAQITNRLLKGLKPTGKGYDINDTELPGFGLRISAEGEPISYSVRYRTPNGRRQRIKIGSARVLTPMQARDEAKMTLADVVRGKDPQEIKKRLRGIQTLGKFIDEEYATHELTHRKSGVATLNRLKACFREFWNRPLSDRNMNAAILSWRARRIKQELSHGTINRDIASLRSVFSHAVRLGLVSENPLKGIRQLRTDPSSNIRYLKENEEKRLFAALDKREEWMRRKRESANAWREKVGYEILPDYNSVSFVDHLKPMVILSLNTGMRRGEIFGIEWRDVDLKQANLTIRGEITKNGKTRHVPLNETAQAVLRKWKFQTSGEGHVFKSPRSGSRFSNVDAAWRNLLEAAKISDFRWHDIRHHFTSKLVMQGVDLNTVRELLGHGDIKMTLRYAHLAPKVKADAVARLDKAHA